MIKFTKSGWLYIFLTILLGAAAVNTNNNMAYLVTSFMLALMGISGIVGKKNIEDISFHTSYKNEIFANRQGYINLYVKNNKKFFPSTMIFLKIKNQINDIIFIPPKSEIPVTIPVKFNKRGYALLNRIEISSPFPFNLFIRKKIYSINEKFLIFPEPINGKIPSKTDILENRYKTLLKNVETGDISSLKNFNNESLKLIFWKYFAKTDILMIKNFQSEQSEVSFLDVDDLVEQTDMETALSISTGIILKFFSTKTPLTVKIKNDLYTLNSYNTKIKILSELALYDKN